MKKTYSEMIKLKTYEERLEYLQDINPVGQETFGYNRYLNQALYQRDPRWKEARRKVIIRDQGCDLGLEDRPIHDKVIVHHMNPISLDDIKDATEYLLNAEYLVCVSKETHDAIHYGDGSLLMATNPIERTPGDTKLW